MTLHPDEQAREFLSPYFDMLDALGSAKMNRDVHSAKLTALLARVKLAEAEWWADPERQNGPRTLYPNEQDHIDELKRQAAGERK